MKREPDGIEDYQALNEDKKISTINYYCRVPVRNVCSIVEVDDILVQVIAGKDWSKRFFELRRSKIYNSFFFNGIPTWYSQLLFNRDPLSCAYILSFPTSEHHIYGQSISVVARISCPRYIWYICKHLHNRQQNPNLRKLGLAVEHT